MRIVYPMFFFSGKEKKQILAAVQHAEKDTSGEIRVHLAYKTQGPVFGHAQKVFQKVGMTKTAQLAVSRGLAELTAGTGVTVNAVLPGPTRSDGVETFIGEMAKAANTTADAMAEGFVKQHRPSSLLQRFATVDEIANMVVYAVSKEASATNGAALRVEGGILRSVA